MATNTSSTRNNLVLNGRIPDLNRTFFSRHIPVSIHASDNGVTFTVHQKKKFSKTVTYEELHSASATNFLWKKKIIIYAEAGTETIRCFGSRERISEFCKFVNNKVTASKKPSGPRFQLTRLEVPPEQKIQLGENVPRGYDSAIDFLFAPEKWSDDMLDKLGREISISEPKISLEDKQEYKAVIKPKDVNSGGEYDLFGYRKDVDWNFYVPKEHLRKSILVILIIILGIVAAWQLGELPGMESGSLTTVVEKGPVTPPEAIAPPKQNKPIVSPRALEQLVRITHDDERYQRIVEAFKKKRILFGLSTDDISARMAWEKQDVESFESGESRLTVMELIEYALAVDEDIHDFIEDMK